MRDEPEGTNPPVDAWDDEPLLDIRICVNRDGSTNAWVKRGEVQPVDEERALFRLAAEALAGLQHVRE